VALGVLLLLRAALDSPDVAELVDVVILTALELC